MYYSWIPVKVAFHDLLLYLQGRQKKKNLTHGRCFCGRRYFSKIMLENYWCSTYSVHHYQ